MGSSVLVHFAGVYLGTGVLGVVFILGAPDEKFLCEGNYKKGNYSSAKILQCPKNAAKHFLTPIQVPLRRDILNTLIFTEMRKSSILTTRFWSIGMLRRSYQGSANQASVQLIDEADAIG